jgi:glycosyltransferase involved in cell wall biosynthesis
MVQNNARAKFLRILASNIVSLIERYSNNWVDAYILAETCYSNEMPAIKNYISIENKYFEQRSFNNNIQINPNQALQFLMSGTLSPVYGTLEGLNWFKQLLKRYPHFQLLIIGHVPIPSFIDDLVAAAKNCSQIQLNISRHPIDYKHIIEAYKQSDIHLLPYRQLPSISPKIPSKLYDCMALALPVIYSPNTKWKTYIESNSGGIEVDFYKAEQAVEQFSKILNRKFFINGGYENATYPIEKHKFLNLIQHLSKE